MSGVKMSGAARSNGLPNFIIAGGVATGTSFLSHAMSSHPQVFLPKVMRPECNFFYKSWEYKKGPLYYAEKYFSDVKDEIAIGERSSLYLHGDFLGVPKRIYDLLPNVKLIFCLRNPTERAFANYRFSVLSGYEHKSFERALESENLRFERAKGWKSEIQPNLYRRRGKYMSQLQEFLTYFPRENLLFIKSEEMNKNPNATLSQVFNFLGVRNETVALPNNFTSNTVRSGLVQRGLRTFFGSDFDTLTENIRLEAEPGFAEKLISLNVSKKKVSMPDKCRDQLNDYFREENYELGKFLDWDVSDWIK
jgi:hypothetical protein